MELEEAVALLQNHQDYRVLHRVRIADGHVFVTCSPYPARIVALFVIK